MKIFNIVTLIKSVIIFTLFTACTSGAYRQVIDAGTLVYERDYGLVLKPQEQKRTLWDNGKLCYIATGLPNGRTQWQLYARSIPSDSVFMVAKKQVADGFYSEHRDGQHIIGYFKNGYRDGLFILKKKGKVVMYELWENRKLIQVVNVSQKPQDDLIIITSYGKF